MPRESEYLTLMRISNPRSIRRRIKTAPLINLAGLAILVPVIGLFNNSIAADLGLPGTDWTFGGALWLIGLGLVPVYLLFVVRLGRAIVVYTMLTLAVFPVALAILAVALRFSMTVLGELASVIIAIGLLLGLGMLPLVVRERRQRYQSAIARGHLRRSLDKERATWDPQFDHDEDMSKEWLKRPGCFIRLLPWVGPAIGMRLADVFGRNTANLIVVAAAVFVGYLLVYSGLVQAIVQLLEFGRMEAELGRPIMLAEEPAPEKPSAQ